MKQLLFFLIGLVFISCGSQNSDDKESGDKEIELTTEENKKEITANLDTIFEIQTIENKEEYIRIYQKYDTSIQLPHYTYAVTEHFELLKKETNGTIQTILPKTNFLDLLCGTYYITDVVKNEFRVIDT